MARPLALLFDMDGTIVDNMAFHTDTWLELLRRHGVETTAEQFFHETAGMVNAQIMRVYFGADVSEAEIVRFGNEKEEIYRERYAPHIRPVDGLPELIAEARSLGMKLGLATSAPPANIAFTLGGTGLTEAFDAIVGSRDVTHGKPHPEIYLVAAERLGVAPESCLVFEDAPIGIESAVRAGMEVAVVTTVLTAEQAAAQPGVAHVIRDFHEARKLLA